MDLLKELYGIHSPSGCEFRIQDRIRRELYTNCILYEVDNFNQTYFLGHAGAPLISCHTDQIGRIPTSHVIETKSFFSGDTNIGADDKNGIWIVLKLLQEFKVNFVFSCDEERGGNLEHLLNKHNTDPIPYALVFDRMGGGDIIGEQNFYCSKEFEAALVELGTPYGYAPDMGTFSDADCISEYMNCVNLSCGYYHAHTDAEYTDKEELSNSLEFGKCILRSDLENDVFPDPEKGWWGAYGNYSNTSLTGSVSRCPDCNGLLIAYAMGSGKGSGQICQFCGYDSVIDEYLY